MTRYLVAPMREWNVTQPEYGGFSHKNSMAVDVAGKDRGIDEARTSTYLKVIGTYTSKYGDNTAFFVTCDENGIPYPVMCTDMKERILTIQMTHIDTYGNIVIGKVFKPWEVFYTEGTSGYATGNHIHIEVAEGIQKTFFWNSKTGSTYMKNQISNTVAFWMLRGYTTVLNTGGMKWHWLDKEQLGTTTGSNGGPDMILTLTKAGSILRDKPLGSAIKKITRGDQMTILELTNKKELDDRKWCKVQFNDIIGYVPFDLSFFDITTK